MVSSHISAGFHILFYLSDNTIRSFWHDLEFKSNRGNIVRKNYPKKKSVKPQVIKISGIDTELDYFIERPPPLTSKITNSISCTT